MPDPSQADIFQKEFDAKFFLPSPHPALSHQNQRFKATKQTGSSKEYAV
jgi:hypothetical protein